MCINFFSWTDLTVAKRREFLWMIHWLTINNHPSNPQQPIHSLRLAPISDWSICISFEPFDLIKSLHLRVSIKNGGTPLSLDGLFFIENPKITWMMSPGVPLWLRKPWGPCLCALAAQRWGGERWGNLFWKLVELYRENGTFTRKTWDIYGISIGISWDITDPFPEIFFLQHMRKRIFGVDQQTQTDSAED